MEFNIFQTFFRARPNSEGIVWVQIVEGRVVAAFTKEEFRRELKLIAKDL